MFSQKKIIIDFGLGSKCASDQENVQFYEWHQLWFDPKINTKIN